MRLGRSAAKRGLSVALVSLAVAGSAAAYGAAGSARLDSRLVLTDVIATEPDPVLDGRFDAIVQRLADRDDDVSLDRAAVPAGKHV